jgi:anti-sigma B factor antagonist
MPLLIFATEHDELTILSVGGELDMSTAPDLLKTALPLIEAGRRQLVLDLDELTFCDSAGLSAFVQLQRRMTTVGGALALARPQQIVRAVLELTGLAELMQVSSTLDLACTTVRG